MSTAIDMDNKATEVKATVGSLTNQSIDRKETKPIRAKKNYKKVREDIPDHIAQMVVEQVLSRVGNMDWNDPLNVSKTIAQIMSIDTEQPVETWSEQVPYAFDVDRTVMVPARDTKKSQNGTIPFWICQSLIRVDDSKGNRYIEYNGSKYNRIDIIFGNKYFRQSMNKVAKAAGCTWNARWGNSRNPKHKLYNKTRPGEESWLDKCVKPLVGENETNGIDIRDLVMIEFKRKI